MAAPAIVRDRTLAAAPSGNGGAAPPMFDLIELFFFAYRDFVGDADRLLADLSFGRAHHRVLHFVHRHPGLTVNALLDILKITKQSLNRVMKDLTDQRLIEIRTGTDDRRRRLLRATPEGCRLALELAHLQSERFRRTLDGLPAEARPHAVAFLLAMIDPGERAQIADLIWGSGDRAADADWGAGRGADRGREHAA